MSVRLAAALWLVALPVLAQDVVTVWGYPACTQERFLDQYLAASSSNDGNSVQFLLDNKRCVIVKGDIKVTPLEYPGMLGGRWKALIYGVEMWMPRKGMVFVDEAPTQKPLAKANTRKEQTNTSRVDTQQLNKPGIVKSSSGTASISLMPDDWSSNVSIGSIGNGASVMVRELKVYKIAGVAINRVRVEAVLDGLKITGWMMAGDILM